MIQIVQHSVVERMLKQRQYIQEGVHFGFSVRRVVRPVRHVFVGLRPFDLVHGAHADGRKRERVQRQVRVLNRGHCRRRVELQPHGVH